MRRADVNRFCFGLTLVMMVAVLSACGQPATEPCYTIESLHATGTAVSDTVAARQAFAAYQAHVQQTEGYPVYGWSRLEYRRAAGTERSRGVQYWGIAAWGFQSNGDSLETTMFRVREDGTIVAKLGCI